MEIIWLILLIFNIILYGAICFGIMRKSTFTCISIRSPKLLILTYLSYISNIKLFLLFLFNIY